MSSRSDQAEGHVVALFLVVHRAGLELLAGRVGSAHSDRASLPVSRCSDASGKGDLATFLARYP